VDTSFIRQQPFPPNVMRPEDITDQEVRGFNDGEVLQRVHNVDQMLRDVEFQRVNTPSELARLKQFTEDSNKPLYPDCQKYSRLSGDLKLMQLKGVFGIAPNNSRSENQLCSMFFQPNMSSSSSSTVDLLR
jgi:hypothetical protein